MRKPIETNTEGLQEILRSVNSLPTAASVQRASGSFTTAMVGEWAEFSFDCGFKPDYVMFTQGKTGTYDGGITYHYIATATFEKSDYCNVPLWETAENLATTGLLYDISGLRNSTGLVGSVSVLTANMEYLPFIGTFQWTAIKYTG